MVVEAMLDELEPVMKSESPTGEPDILNFGVSTENILELESWMISLKAFSRNEPEPELAVQDWMLSTSTWQAD